jgi:hypothetical protein
MAHAPNGTGAKWHSRQMAYKPPEHVDSENIILEIGSRPLLYQLFSKCDFYSYNVATIGKN